MDEVISKYLARQADEIARAPMRVEERFSAAVVVPLYAETPHCLDRLLEAGALTTRVQGLRNLLVLVVNEPRGAPVAQREQNRALLTAVESRFARVQPSVPAGMSFLVPNKASDPVLLLVDLTGTPLDPKEGVGRARKIGFDCALRLFHETKLVCPFAGSADADVTLPGNYLDAFEQAEALGRVRGLPAVGALLFSYRHESSGNEALDRAMERVEMTFRLYVLGLASAGSPYAYHSLGSALAVSLPHYARVRGFPRRAAGEDFYLLSKVAQIAPLRRLAAPLVSIQTRFSDRVPFGTGPSLQRAQTEGARTYHPEAYRMLSDVLERLQRLVRCPKPNVDLFPQGRNLPSWVDEWVRPLWAGIEPTLAACPTEEHRVRRLHESLDALKTLQFIHEAHRRGLPLLPPEQAAELMEIGGENGLLAALRAEELGLIEWVGPVAYERAKPA